MVPDEVRAVATDDGWQVGVRRYPAEGPPVLLVHGMGANHYNWDYRPEVSLAHDLQQHGWDVWIADLRGDPGTVGPTETAHLEFGFTEHARRDLPVIVDTILAETGAASLAWVGHSMGGMLLYTALSAYPEKIHAGVAVCSPATFSGDELMTRAARALGIGTAESGRIPSRTWARMSTPLRRTNPFYGRLANRDNLDWAVTFGMAQHGLVDLPVPMIGEGLRWLETGEFIDRQGAPWIEPAHVPLLVFGASKDRVVPEPDVAAACSIYPDCTYRLLGTAGGFSVEYGHIDPVLGLTAPEEVYPVIRDFLEQHRPAPVARADPPGPLP